MYPQVQKISWSARYFTNSFNKIFATSVTSGPKVFSYSDFIKAPITKSQLLQKLASQLFLLSLNFTLPPLHILKQMAMSNRKVMSSVWGWRTLCNSPFLETVIKTTSPPFTRFLLNVVIYCCEFIGHCLTSYRRIYSHRINSLSSEKVLKAKPSQNYELFCKYSSREVRTLSWIKSRSGKVSRY